jgi:hypothetical protein
MDIRWIRTLKHTDLVHLDCAKMRRHPVFPLCISYWGFRNAFVALANAGWNR